MRKISVFLLITALSAFTGSKEPLSEKERKFASSFLANTRNTLVDITKNLSEEQLKYKTSPDRWSVEECVKHIAASENTLWKMADSIINTSANPEKRSEIKLTDEQVIAMITDRSFKAQAPEQLKPQNTPFQNCQEALNAFTEKRDKLIQYINSTGKDLRGHVTSFPIGTVDAYQIVLFIGAHSKRHTLQIQEVMADAGFPKK
ncbi:MAG TPA: DinB family protein [Flavitalea sp.]|nr:DinB family protein [Flavitalea sp.]